MSQPVVTVCVPVYNTARYIRQCIEGVFAQEFKDWLLLVSDNCSTDGTWEILQQLHHPQMRLYRQPQNLGGSVNWMSLWNRVETDYFCFLGSDDYFYPNHLGNKVRLLERYPETPFVHGAVDFINEAGEPANVAPLNEFLPPVESNREALARLLRHNYINITSVVFRTAAFSDSGAEFETRLRFFGDWHLYVELALHHPLVVYDQQTTLAYRMHQASDTQRNIKGFQWAMEGCEHWQLSFDKHPQAWAKLGFDTKAMSARMTSRLWAFAFQQWRRGNRENARKAWQTFRRFHSPAYIVRDFLPYAWQGLNRRVRKRA